MFSYAAQKRNKSKPEISIFLYKYNLTSNYQMLFRRINYLRRLIRPLKTGKDRPGSKSNGNSNERKSDEHRLEAEWKFKRT